MFYTTKYSGVGMGLSILHSPTAPRGPGVGGGELEPRGAIFQFTLPGAENKFMNSLLSSEV